eukprot:scaffold21.g2177.t1
MAQLFEKAMDLKASESWGRVCWAPRHRERRALPRQSAATLTAHVAAAAPLRQDKVAMHTNGHDGFEHHIKAPIIKAVRELTDMDGELESASPDAAKLRTLALRRPLEKKPAHRQRRLPRTRAPLRPTGAGLRCSPPQDALRDWEPTLSGEEGLLASYADVCRATTRAAAAQRGARAGGTLLRDIMCRQEELICATPEMFVTDAAQLLARVGGVPVVVGDGSMRLVGVLCRSDLESRQGFHDVMAQLPLELGPDDSVTSAACLMLKHKARRGWGVRRVPVVDREFNCIGIVTATGEGRAGARADVWVAMAVDSGADSRNLDML